MSDKSIQDQIGMADSFEEALRLITENPPKPEDKYNRKPINLSLIKVDPARLQSRIETCRAVVEQYIHESRSGDQFPPMVVFFDTQKQCVWLADGFHRYEMYKELEYRWADCDVRFGSLQDAIEFAATANTKHGLRITTKDRKKSAEMLFGINQYWESSNAVIARKVGVSSNTIDTWRSQYAMDNNMKKPTVLRSADGRNQKSIRVRNVTSIEDALAKIYFEEANNGYFLCHKNDREFLGSEIDSARSKVVELFSSGYFSRGGRETGYTLTNPQSLRRSIIRNGVNVFPSCVGGSTAVAQAKDFPPEMLLDFKFDGGCIRIADNLTQENFTKFFGDLVLGSPIGRSGRRVVLCRVAPEIAPLVRLAERHGVEFLTPEEFIASVLVSKAESA